MKRFTNSLIAVSICSMLLVACGGSPKKASEPEQDSGGFKTIDDVAGITNADPNAVLSIEQRFGPNPYLARAPQVPTDAGVQFGLALAALNGKEYEEAELQLASLIEKYPGLSGPAYNLAVLKFNRGDKEAAKENIEIALSRNYYNLDARNFKAHILRDEGDFSGAEKEYLEIITLWGGYLPAYRNLGILYDIYMGDIEKGLEQYKKYNDYAPEQDRQVYGWTLDIERRLKAQRILQERQAAAEAAAQQQQEAAPAEQGAEQTDSAATTAEGG